jgi:hypothetical protein
MNLIFTLCSNNYLAQAITLGKSIASFNPGYSFIIGLVDQKHGNLDYTALPFEVVEMDKIGIPDIEALIRKYEIRELNTAVKASFFKYFMKEMPEQSFATYLDPDILVYDSFHELEAVMRDHDFALTPHFTTPLNDMYRQQEEDFLNSGLYNLGFLSVKKSPAGLQMLDWWEEKLLSKAYIRFEKGLFTDQIWINFLPLYYDKVAILNHKGYNVAYWNLHEREILPELTVCFREQVFPLTFYHFSGYHPDHPEILSKYQDRFNLYDHPHLRDLFDTYRERLKENGFSQYTKINCVYSGIREKVYLEQRKDALRRMPFFKRSVRSIMLRLIRKMKIELDLNLSSR